MHGTLDRRTFMTGAAAATATAALATPRTSAAADADRAVRLGLIGCGNRGTAVATSFMRNTPARVAAIADLFEDQLLAGKQHFNGLNRDMGYPELRDSDLFLGSSAYRKLLDRNDIDAVYIATPTFVHPVHFEAAVRSGKHVYCEKPVGIDVAGVERIHNAARDADPSQSLTVGLQIRYASPYAEMIRRIHRGQIGDIVTVQAYYYAGMIPLVWRRDVSWQEARLRAWFWDETLSGSILLDQGIHILDVCNWGIGACPLRASGMGGRKGRNDPGDAWGHFMVNYEYPGNIHLTFHNTQFDPGYGDVCVRFFGTRGTAEAHYTGGVFIKGEDPWDSGVARGTAETISKQDWAAGTFTSSLQDADPNKQKAFIASIQNGTPLNEVPIGVEGTLTAILGRTAAYSREMVEWDGIVNSNDTIDPGIDISRFDAQ